MPSYIHGVAFVAIVEGKSVKKKGNTDLKQHYITFYLKIEASNSF